MGVVCLIIHKLLQLCIQLIFVFALNRGSHVLKELGRLSEEDGRVLAMAA